MIYRQLDNRRQKKKGRYTAIIVGLFFLVVLVLNFTKPTLFSPAVHAVTKPFLEAKGGFFGGVANFFSSLKSKDSLARENQELRRRLALFDAIEIERNYYKEENAALLSMTENSSSTDKYRMVRILSKPGFSPYDTVIIGAGKDDGVFPGSYVLASEKTAIGFVSESYNQTSVVTLYSSPHKETHVLVGPQSIEVVALGKGGGNFDIKFPRNTEIKTGDAVVLASSSPYIIGAIQHITTSPTDSFERALFKSSVDINKLTYVLIEK